MLQRDFFPKGTDFTTITNEEVLQAQDLLNTHPRKTLGFDLPAARLAELLTVAQTPCSPIPHHTRYATVHRA